MLLGPIFAREASIAPRRVRTYGAVAAYVGILAVLLVTAWLVLTGSQKIRDVGDFARFGCVMFALIAPLQLAVVMFLGGMSAAGAVAQEKDRKTLVLLLLTHLSNGELVVGKLASALLGLLMMVTAALPLLMLAAAWGGVSLGQILWALLITLMTVLAAGSIGSTLALWREKTFQALAMTVMTLVAWVGLGEALAGGMFGELVLGASGTWWATAISPWQAITAIAAPRIPPITGPDLLGGAATAASPVVFCLLAGVVVVLANVIAVWRVRAWNTVTERRRDPESAREAPAVEIDPLSELTEAGAVRAAAAREAAERKAQAAAAKASRQTSRRVWNNPILWRETRTWAYGRKILLVRAVYLAIAAVLIYGLYQAAVTEDGISRALATATFVPLALLSLVLISAQAVTAITSERDGKALELLLVTDLSPPEIVFGKLIGVAYNAKEMILVPVAIAVFLAVTRIWGFESPGRVIEQTAYVLVVFLTLAAFVMMLGVHSGIRYANTRTAAATCLGTVFFLFLGVATCMRLMIAFSGSFQAQLQPFLAFMIGGGLGLYVALSARRPSTAIGLASFLCPVATFYALTSYLLSVGGTGHTDQMATVTAALVTTGTYGFATAAMLMPALSEINFATDRPVTDE